MDAVWGDLDAAMLERETTRHEIHVANTQPAGRSTRAQTSTANSGSAASRSSTHTHTPRSGSTGGGSGGGIRSGRPVHGELAQGTEPAPAAAPAPAHVATHASDSSAAGSRTSSGGPATRVSSASGGTRGSEAHTLHPEAAVATTSVQTGGGAPATSPVGVVLSPPAQRPPAGFTYGLTWTLVPDAGPGGPAPSSPQLVTPLVTTATPTATAMQPGVAAQQQGAADPTMSRPAEQPPAPSTDGSESGSVHSGGPMWLPFAMPHAWMAVPYGHPGMVAAGNFAAMRQPFPLPYPFRHGGGGVNTAFGVGTPTAHSVSGRSGLVGEAPGAVPGPSFFPDPVHTTVHPDTHAAAARQPGSGAGDAAPMPTFPTSPAGSLSEAVRRDFRVHSTGSQGEVAADQHGASERPPRHDDGTQAASIDPAPMDPPRQPEGTGSDLQAAAADVATVPDAGVADVAPNAPPVSRPHSPAHSANGVPMMPGRSMAAMAFTYPWGYPMPMPMSMSMPGPGFLLGTGNSSLLDGGGASVGQVPGDVSRGPPSGPHAIPDWMPATAVGLSHSGAWVQAPTPGSMRSSHAASSRAASKARTGGSVSHTRSGGGIPAAADVAGVMAAAYGSPPAAGSAPEASTPAAGGSAGSGYDTSAAHTRRKRKHSGGGPWVMPMPVPVPVPMQIPPHALMAYPPGPPMWGPADAALGGSVGGGGSEAWMRWWPGGLPSVGGSAAPADLRGASHGHAPHDVTAAASSPSGRGGAGGGGGRDDEGGSYESTGLAALASLRYLADVADGSALPPTLDTQLPSGLPWRNPRSKRARVAGTEDNAGAAVGEMTGEERDDRILDGVGSESGYGAPRPSTPPGSTGARRGPVAPTSVAVGNGSSDAGGDVDAGVGLKRKRMGEDSGVPPRSGVGPPLRAGVNATLPPTSSRRVSALQNLTRSLEGVPVERQSQLIRSRATWIGVSYVARLGKHRSFIFHPTDKKTVSCGTFATAYEAAKARHRLIASLPPTIAAHLSDDFTYDPLDPDAKDEVTSGEAGGS